MSSATERRVGPDRGRLLLRTTREGPAAQVGHDLTLEVGRWSGAVRATADPAAGSVEVTVELASLRVLAGSGGVRPLSERDKQEIVRTACRLLDTRRRPHARFSCERVARSGVITGILSVRGETHPLELEITRLGEERYRATGIVVQSRYGIRPYTAFFGALRLADPVRVEAEVDLSHPEPVA